jgi:hypothetical protein
MKIQFLPQRYDVRGKKKLKGRALHWHTTCTSICNTRLGNLQWPGSHAADLTAWIIIRLLMWSISWGPIRTMLPQFIPSQVYRDLSQFIREKLLDVKLTYSFTNASFHILNNSSSYDILPFSKRKSNAITGLDRPWVFQEFEAFKTFGTWRWQGCQPYAPAAFTPRKYPWYSFPLEAEPTPGP